MSFKNRLYGLERPSENNSDNSNLSGSTFKQLKISKLRKLTDKPLTKKTFDYKLPELYDAGGDIKKQWFVYYSYKDPVTKKFKRFKVFEDLNTFKTVKERRSRAMDIIIPLTEALLEGITPFSVNTHPVLNNSDRTIVKCIDKYMAYIESNSLSRHTKRKYKYELGIFKEWLTLQAITILDISEVKKQHIREFIDYLKSTRDIKSGKTLNSYLTNLRTFFNHFINNYDDYLYRNPGTGISSEKVIVKGNVAYTEKEFAAIKKEILKSDPYLWLICQVVYYSALRNEAEAINIKIGDFDLRRGRINVPAEISKARKQQSIPIYPEFKTVLESLNLDQYPENYFLFGRNDKPGPVRVGEDRFARRFREIKKELNMGSEYGIYAFKHTRACHLFDDGADLREIQLLFRHEDLHVTMNYLRTLNRVERARSFDKGREI